MLHIFPVGTAFFFLTISFSLLLTQRLCVCSEPAQLHYCLLLSSNAVQGSLALPLGKLSWYLCPQVNFWLTCLEVYWPWASYLDSYSLYSKLVTCFLTRPLCTVKWGRIFWILCPSTVTNVFHVQGSLWWWNRLLVWLREYKEGTQARRDCHALHFHIQCLCPPLSFPRPLPQLPYLTSYILSLSK